MTLRANQLRLWLSSAAHILVSALRRTALRTTRMAEATYGSIRLKFFNVGAQIKLSVRQIFIHFAGACPYQDVFIQAWQNLLQHPLRC